MSAQGGVGSWRECDDGAVGVRLSTRELWLPFATSALLVVAFLALPLSGTDLSAAVARADFASDHAFAPIDFSWFGGTNQFGYSLVSQYLMALLGARPAGALAAFAAASASPSSCAGARWPIPSRVPLSARSASSPTSSAGG